MFFVLVNKTINDVMETVIHAEIQSEDELTQSLIERPQTMYADVALPMDVHT